MMNVLLKKSPVFVIDELEMIPLDKKLDKEYFFELASKSKYNEMNRSQFEQVLEENVIFAWTVYVSSVKSGVCYIAYWPAYSIYTLDGYRDDRLVRSINSKKSFSTVSAQLVLRWFFGNIANTIYTIHAKRNRAATVLCNRLGFKRESKQEINGKDYLVFRMRGQYGN